MRGQNRVAEATEEDEQERVVKRARLSISAAAQEFICPISMELPIDPVTADGETCFDLFKLFIALLPAFF